MDHAQINALEQPVIPDKSFKTKLTAGKKIARHWELYFLVLLPVLYLIIFKYVPMFGVQIAFKDFNVVQGIWGSGWVGLKHFETFFTSPNFWVIIKNTLEISFYSLLAGFPIPILLALALNEVRTGKFKKIGANGYLRAPFYFYRRYGFDCYVDAYAARRRYRQSVFFHGLGNDQLHGRSGIF